MSAAIIKFATTCAACRQGLHDRCWQHLAELMGAASVPCPCNCRDQHGELTHAALVEMAQRHPDALARRIRTREAIERGSLGIHLRTAGTTGRRAWPQCSLP